MNFPPRYDATEVEPRLQAAWTRDGLYQFQPTDTRPIFAIDTPPPTVSGEIHIGHVYSYIQAEAMIRFWRMQGYNIYYPFGFDDNGLPTERYVERVRGIRARDLSREAFIEACLEVSQEVEDRFETFWRSLGMSVDWRLRYSTIDPVARRTSQWSFIDLFRKGRISREQAPNPWCVECQTAIAQAEMEDVERTTNFYTLQFTLAESQAILPIATTRPELLPACVAIFVHPEDTRYAELIGHEALVPLIWRRVPILADAAVDPQKGSGAVMCCTFGDMTDVQWWQQAQLPLIPLVTRQGRLSAEGGVYAGLTLREARTRILADLQQAGLILGQQELTQTVRVHDRCQTPLEILETKQWFVRVLDAKEELLEAGQKITWHPAHMQTRYEHWVANLNWDWCISRQRFYGVPFPAWHCDACGAIILADETQLPVDPLTTAPPRACDCGNSDLRPDTDVMDTWATSSMSPQIATRMLDDPALAARLFPMQLRPQAHDIIRTWAFYTIVKSWFLFGTIPWETLAISGHALDPSGHKVSKSKGNAPIMPTTLIERFGADAVRYWACHGTLGADQALNERMMKQGTRLVTKLWNASRFIAEAEVVPRQHAVVPQPTQTADRALLSWLQRLIERVTASYRDYDYAAALEAIERFFWGTFCDNYLEFVKSRLYDGDTATRQQAQQVLRYTLETLLKLLAPIMPHITEEIYQQLFADAAHDSIHIAAWPELQAALIDPTAEQAGEILLLVAGFVRRYKTAHQRGLGTPIAQLTLAVDNPWLRSTLNASEQDLRSVTRATEAVVVAIPEEGYEELMEGLWGRIDA